MKIIQSIKAFTFKAIRKFIDFIAPANKQQDMLKLTRKHTSKIQKKRGSRRWDFQSYLAKHASRSSSKSILRHRKIKKMHYTRRFLDSALCESFQSYNLKEQIAKKSKKVVDLPIEVASGIQLKDHHVFFDKYGSQISAIQQNNRKNALFNSSIQSDNEILKFVFGDEDQLQKDEHPKQLQEVFEKKEEYDMACQDQLAEVDQMLSDSANQADQSLQRSKLEGKCNQKNKKIKHNPKNKNNKKLASKRPQQAQNHKAKQDQSQNMYYYKLQ